MQIFPEIQKLEFKNPKFGLQKKKKKKKKRVHFAPKLQKSNQLKTNNSKISSPFLYFWSNFDETW